MRRSYKYRLFTNANQERELSIALETCRRIHNEFLGYKVMAWDCCQSRVSYVDGCRWLTAQRNVNPFYARLNSTCARSSLRKVELAFEWFFQRIRAGKPCCHPRFKSADRFDSMQFTYADGIKLIGNRLRVQHVGVIRAKVHRPHQGRIATATIKRESGKWYVILSCDLGERQIPRSPNPPIGIDLGLKEFVTTSDGELLGDTGNLERALPELRRRQRALSRCKRGSSRRKNVKLGVTKLYAKVRNCRRDTHHKVAKSLVDRYGTIAAESLTIKNMMGNRRLARRIADAGWYSFIEILAHKAESAGCQLILVDPKNTSQMCSACGDIVRKSLAVRVHKCECGCELDRDENAARNILARAEPSGVNVSNSLHGRKSRQLRLVV